MTKNLGTGIEIHIENEAENEEINPMANGGGQALYTLTIKDHLLHLHEKNLKGRLHGGNKRICILKEAGTPLVDIPEEVVVEGLISWKGRCLYYTFRALLLKHTQQPTRTARKYDY